MRELELEKKSDSERVREIECESGREIMREERGREREIEREKKETERE